MTLDAQGRTLSVAGTGKRPNEDGTFTVIAYTLGGRVMRYTERTFTAEQATQFGRRVFDAGALDERYWEEAPTSPKLRAR